MPHAHFWNPTTSAVHVNVPQDKTALEGPVQLLNLSDWSLNWATKCPPVCVCICGGGECCAWLPKEIKALGMYMNICIRNFTVCADDHLSKLKKLPTLDFQAAKAASSPTAYPSEMEFQTACEALDAAIAAPPKKPSLCSTEIPFVADMQLQVDFAYWKFWGFVRDFAKADDLSVPINVCTLYETASFCIFGIWD